MFELFPKDIINCIEEFEKNGFEAYAVGGCVRDILRGEVPNDYDIATNATPAQVRSIFTHTVPTGERFGTITVLLDSRAIEVTTFRSETAYSDFRRPDEVKFGNNINADVSRRDFTINAMAYSPRTGLLDLFNGQADLKNKIIRAIGVPSDRFTEDALRIMRAFRFSARFGFEIEDKTLSAAVSCSELLKRISIERIRDELMHILATESPQKIEPLAKSGAFEFLGIGKPESLKKLSEAPMYYPARLMLFLILCKCQDNALENLMLDNRTFSLVSFFMSETNKPLPKSKEDLKSRMASFSLYDWGILFKSICIYREINVDNYLTWLSEIEKNEEPYRISMLAVNGYHIKELGITNGLLIGRILNECLSYVIEDPARNTLSELSEFIKNNHIK